MAKKNPQPKAIPAAVSRALGEYRDENGDGLTKAEIVKTKYGPEEFGGYKVCRGAEPGKVLVRWIAPDAMDVSNIAKNRDKFLGIYTDILLAKGFTVIQVSYGLSVYRLYK